MPLSKSIECAMPRVNPNVNYGLWVIMMCQCNVSSVITNAPLWWEMLIIGEAIHLWKHGTYVVSLYLPLNFAMNLKLLLKK